MNLVTVQSVSKQYSDRVLLKNVELLINKGDRIALIGRNGSGKSTLIRLLTGSENPDTGKITIWGKVRVRYLAQEPVLDESATVLDTIFLSDSPQMKLLLAYEKVMAELNENPADEGVQARFAHVQNRMDIEEGWSAEANAKTILSKLGIRDYSAIVGTLSGGQRKRVALARALLDAADLLILDEPTNHLDAETIAWLEGYLANQPNGLLMVTHDRYFLDQVATHIVELDRQQLAKYEGNYTAYLEEKGERDEQFSKKEEKRKSLLKRELEWMRRQPQGRGTKPKARKQRAEELMEFHIPANDQKMAMALAGRRLGKSVLTATNLSFGYDDTPLFSNVDFRLEKGDRIGILGPNGAGKSTLLNLLADRLSSPTGSIEWGETVHLGYYDQHAEGLQNDATIIDFIQRKMPMIETGDGTKVEAAKMLEWFLFSRGEQQSLIGSLSGGERRRLYLLYILMLQPNVLFLDEPTNDLDIQTLQVLEQFLDHFKGALVVISHDRYFLDRNVDYLYTFDGKSVGSRYPTPYESYLEKKTAEDAQHTQEKKQKQAVKQKPKSAERKLTYKEKKELASVENKMETLSEKIDALEEAINQSGTDYQKLAGLSAELETVKEELELVEFRWLELSEIEG